MTASSATAVPGGLAWLLDDLVERVPVARHAVLLSVDGLVVGASSAMAREDAEHLAAASAGLSSLAKGTGRRFGAGAVRQTVIELTDAYLLIASAGPGACLAILTGPETDLGLLAYETELLVARVGPHLAAPARSGPAGADRGESRETGPGR
ncbi:putative regulator of Ras-like GTPase activity (Roadblock/LC7/MglB family) [Allocatelliglobosispora scoriae]|uniref:Putative regulator of Ras-like GTPase activity (Roadblock/LC7/MglB family) n=1 Tax=Allocatelliglobosispora scoriae TaxID=643052 RepID=A0A841BZ73_9ACTN|nr:roadblock/LC7 domain-containing protein [Allocatelliglobosispora scoriae]MBB5872985.1 putative regulator of Ras-like GTPase activity (Roadblock/LC7/MglB family) [Allocatelliglobosispora scoriae]